MLCWTVIAKPECSAMLWDDNIVSRWILDDPTSTANKKVESQCKSAIFFPYCFAYSKDHVGLYVIVNDFAASAVEVGALFKRRVPHFWLTSHPRTCLSVASTARTKQCLKVIPL